jgi:hypothetical protein
LGGGFWDRESRGRTGEEKTGGEVNHQNHQKNGETVFPLPKKELPNEWYLTLVLDFSSQSVDEPLPFLRKMPNDLPKLAV